MPAPSGHTGPGATSPAEPVKVTPLLSHEASVKNLEKSVIQIWLAAISLVSVCCIKLSGSFSRFFKASDVPAVVNC